MTNEFINRVIAKNEASCTNADRSKRSTIIMRDASFVRMSGDEAYIHRKFPAKKLKGQRREDVFFCGFNHQLQISNLQFPMGRPYYSRSIVLDGGDRLQIIIPVKKNWLVLILLSFFLLICTSIVLLCLWSLVETMASRKVNGLMILAPIGVFAVVGILTFRKIIGRWRGAETIIVQKGQLILKRESVLNDPREIYDLKEINDLRVYDDADDFTWGQRDRVFKSNSLIRFEYGRETIKFAADISYAEAEYILSLITEKQLPFINPNK